MRKAFAMQKLLTFFQQKILAYLRYYPLNFTETLTYFEQLDPEVFQTAYCLFAKAFRAIMTCTVT